MSGEKILSFCALEEHTIGDMGEGDGDPGEGAVGGYHVLHVFQVVGPLGVWDRTF